MLSASGLGSVLYGLAEAGSRGFDDPFVIFFLIAGAVLAHGLRFAELRISEPMIDARLFKNRFSGRVARPSSWA